MDKKQMYSTLRDNALSTLKANKATPTLDQRLGLNLSTKEMDDVSAMIQNAIKTGNKVDALSSVMCMAQSFEELLMYMWFAASAYTRYVEIMNEKIKQDEK
jgi:hypothetical protein